MYVNNLLTGANTIEKTCEIRDEMIDLLKSGGFHLRQWASNCSKILHGLSENQIDTNL